VPRSAAGRAVGKGAVAPARAAPRARARAQILVITGLSGSGKTHVLRALEDSGWFCVDNLPLALIPRFAELIQASSELRRSALVVDMREPEFPARFPAVYRALRGRGLGAALIFVEASERSLLRRFSETRRPHPLAVNQPVLEGLREEREALGPIRKMADLILDTSEYSVHELRDWVRERYGRRDASRPLVVSVLSFGFRHGVPPEADLVFDVRFLPNPNFVPALKRLTGNDPAVRSFLMRQSDTRALLARLEDFLGFLLPRYIREGKSYLTVAIGCTGGRHRSVTVAAAVARALAKHEVVVKLRHRDLAQS
jgi:RNase adapter protein RapZ